MHKQNFGTKLMTRWLSVWLYVISAVAGGIIALVIVNASIWDLHITLGAISIVVLVWHVLEEWRFPGGFHYMYNLLKKSELLDRYPMNQVSDMLTNFIPIVYGVIMIAIGMPYFASLTAFYLGIAEVIIHTVSGAKTKKLFPGKRTIYNPGLASCYFGFLPLVGGYIYCIIAYPPTFGEIIIGLAIFVMLGAISIVGMERLFRNQDTRFAFNWGNGYYEKFTNKTDAV